VVILAGYFSPVFDWLIKEILMRKIMMVFLPLLLVLAGCGDDDGGSPSSSSTSSDGGLQPVKPVFSPAPGTFEGASVPVSISTATPGATIHYTVDGSEPTTGSTVYSGAAIPVDKATTIKAIAVKAGMLLPQSDVAIGGWLKSNGTPSVTTIATVDAQYGEVRGIAVSGSTVWVVSQKDARGYVFKYSDTGTLLASYGTGTTIPSTATNDGVSLTGVYFKKLDGIVVSEPYVYVSEADGSGNTTLLNRIRRFSSDGSGTVTTVAGRGVAPLSWDDQSDWGNGGASVNARFNLPYRLVVDGTRFLVADYANRAIRSFEDGGITQTVLYGNPPNGVNLLAGQSIAANRYDVNGPRGVVVSGSLVLFTDNNSGIYLLDRVNETVSLPLFSTVAGYTSSGTTPFWNNGSLAASSGCVYFYDSDLGISPIGTRRIYRAPVHGGYIQVLAGNGQDASADGPALSTGVEAAALAIAEGQVWFTEPATGKIRKFPVVE